MFLTEQQTYYDLLEISPSASTTEIKRAYLRMKDAYSKDSVATYSIVSQEDVEFLLKRLEEGLEILSNPEKKRQYDLENGLIPATLDLSSPSTHPSSESKVVSIDRVPPMDISETTDDLLIAPPTHFELPSMTATLGTATLGTSSSEAPTPQNFLDVPTQVKVSPPHYDKNIHSVIDIANFQLELERETEWSGDFIRRTRETLGISIDELAAFSRVSKPYIVAIESDLFKKLPAPVFLRGFLMQICRKLKLPHERVISAYLDRYKTTCPEKF
ncbi:MAG: helix-turn-helix domain-containing protein [Xanthomonadaceae bacterium]|nr:helix-turn-helix domain-containing protein [Xanthomonadaceae bacterium]